MSNRYPKSCQFFSQLEFNIDQFFENDDNSIEDSQNKNAFNLKSLR